MRQAFIDACRSYKGVTWKRGGRSRRGLDCWGLPWVAARDCGLNLIDPWPYRSGEYSRLITGHADQFERVASAEPGDILVLSLPHILPCHIAVKTDVGIIHTIGPGRGVQEHSLRDFHYQIIGAYRIWPAL